MKKLFIVSLLSVLPLSVMAQESSINANIKLDNNTVTVTPKKSDFLGQRRYPMRSDEFYKFQRCYELSNGSTVTLYSRGPIMYAKINDGQAERLTATSRNTFYSSKTILKLKINLLDNDEVSGEAYLATEDRPASPIAKSG